jgi:hypothetical protein
MPQGRRDGGSMMRAPLCDHASCKRVELFRFVDVEVKPHPRRALRLLAQHQLHRPASHQREHRRRRVPGFQESLLRVRPSPAQAKAEHVDVIRDAARDVLRVEDRSTRIQAAAVKFRAHLRAPLYRLPPASTR